MAADEEQIFSFSVPGIDDPVTVPAAKRQAFLAANPQAVERRRYRVPEVGDVWVPDGKAVPEGAERLHRFRDAEGRTYNIPKARLADYVASRSGPAGKEPSWLGRQALAAGNALLGNQVAQAAGDLVVDAATLLPRLSGAVANAVNPDDARKVRNVLTGETERVLPEGAADTYKPGRAARLAEAANRFRAERAEATAPETRAGRIARGVAGTAGKLTELVASGGLALPLMAAEGTVETAERAAANGASGREALGRGLATGTAEAAIFSKLPGGGAAAEGAVRRALGNRLAAGARKAAQKAGRDEVLRAAPDAAARAARLAETLGGAARESLDMGAKMAASEVAGQAGAGDAPDLGAAALAYAGGAAGGALLGGARGFLRSREVAPLVREAVERTAERERIDERYRRAEEFRRAGEPPDAHAPPLLPEEGAPVPRKPGETPPLLRAPGARGAELAAGYRPELPPSGPFGAALAAGRPQIVPPGLDPAAPPRAVAAGLKAQRAMDMRGADAIAMPDPALTPEEAALPTSQADVEKSWTEARAAQPLARRLRETGFSEYLRDHPSPVLDYIGLDRFRALERKYKGDFRNVAGERGLDELAKGYEHEGLTAGDAEAGLSRGARYSGPDGARLLLERAAEEYAAFRQWKARGAPTMEQEASAGDLAAWNRGVQDAARERYASRLAAEDEPPPAIPPEELDAARGAFDAEDEARYVEDLERAALSDEAAPPRLAPEQMAEADAAAKSKSDRIAKNLAGSTETSAWGDLSKSVPIVGDGTPRFVFKKGSSYSSVREELYPIAQRNVEAQPNHITLPGGIPGMRIDGVDYSLPKDGLFHSFGGRADKNSPAVAQIGDVMNASVIVPGIAGDNTFRIAPVDFGEQGFAVLVFDKANKLTDFRLHSINVRTGTAARRVSAPAGSRPTAVTLSQVMRSWQEDFLPELSRRASEKMLAALRDSFPMDAKERKAFHAENRGLAVGANLGGRIVFLGEDARRVGKVLGLEVKGKANSKTDNAVLHFPAEDLIGNLQRLVNAGQRVALFNDGADMADKAQQQGLVEARRAELEARRAELRAKYQALLDVPQTDANARAFDAVVKAHDAVEAELSRLPPPAPEVKPPSFALDGGTPAEIDAEKARAALAAKRAALEEQAAAPGPDAGTVSVQEGLPGLGGDGTLFTPPPGGWAAPGGGGSLADAAGAPEPMISLADRGALAAARETGPAAATRPSSGSVAADSGAAKREGPAARRKREDMALVSEALDACRRHRDGDLSAEELLGYAERLEARSLYGSAALVRRTGGEPALRPGLSTEGAHALWPAQEPGALRVSLAQLVDIATKLGGGTAPVVARRLRALHGRALGYYDPGFGRGMVALKASLAQLVDAEERARIRSEVLAGGGTEEDCRAAIRERVRANMLDDAPAAAQVLAHEIGHWIDDLPELGGALRGRGNVLGHIASLKHYLSKTLFLDPGKHGGFDWDGDAIPGMAPKERDAIVREALKGLKRADFASDEDFAAAKATARREALENAMIERGLAKHEDVRGELDDLIAWYRQSDHAPQYFQKPWEMFAEAFSAWLYYPRTAAAKAPTFCRLIEAWGPKKGEAWEAVREAQKRGGGFAAALGGEGGGDWLARLRERMRATTTAYYALDGHRLPDTRSMGQRWREFYGNVLAEFAGELRWVDWASRKLERRLTGSAAQDGWGTPAGAAARASVHEYLHASTLAEHELMRFRTEVLPILEQGGASIVDLDVYLTLNRVANEVLGAEAQGGRANLFNPDGLTSASARALLGRWQSKEPRSFAAAKAAQERFAAIRRETVLPFAERQAGIGKAEMAEMADNDAYARFMQLFAPREGRRAAAQGEMRASSGIRHQHTGFLAGNVSPSLATLMGDGQIYFDSGLNGARRDAVALLREAFPEAVRLAPMKWDPAAKALVPDQTRGGGWRTVVFRERGEDGRSRVVGYDVRDWAASGLRGVEPLHPAPGLVLRGLDAVSGFTAKSVTALSWGFNLLNPFRDRSGMLRNAPAGPDAGAAEKWTGDLGAAAKSLVNGAGRARKLGEAHPLLMEALRYGAMPGSDFSGWSFNKTAARALENLLRAGGDEKAALAAADEVVRSLGLDPALVGAQRKAWGVLGRVADAAAAAYTWLPGRMARTETNAKAAGYAKVRRAHPDWDPRRAAEFAARYIGTPDPQAPSRFAQIPGIRGLSMFYTMTTRGLGDQILGAGRLQPGLMARRLLAHVAMRQALQNSWWWLVGVGAAGGGLVGALRKAAAPGDGDDEDVAYYKRGLSEAADDLEWFAKAQRAASPFDRAQGYLFPLFTVDEKTGKYAYLKIPYDQSLYPIDALADYAASKFTGMNNFTAESLSDAVAGSAIPSAGPALRELGVVLGGTDIGSGNRPIHPNEDRGLAEHVWDHLATAWNIFTGCGMGVLPARGGFAAAWTDESKTPLERFLALPGVNSTIRPFLRVSNQGDAETARMVQRAVEANKRAERRAATALSRGEDPDAADAEALSRYSSDPGAMVRHAWERDYMRTNAPPSLRALENAPRRMVPDLMETFSIRP